VKAHCLDGLHVLDGLDPILALHIQQGAVWSAEGPLDLISCGLGQHDGFNMDLIWVNCTSVILSVILEVLLFANRQKLAFWYTS